MSWSVRDLIDFSFLPAINAAFEGTWAHGDPPDDDASDFSDVGAADPPETTDSDRD